MIKRNPLLNKFWLTWTALQNERKTHKGHWVSVGKWRNSEAQTQLHDTLKKYTLNYTEAKELHEKLTILEEQILLCQEQAHEAPEISGAHETELYQAMTKLEAFENKYGQMEGWRGAVAVNLKLTQELSVYGSRMNDLLAKLSATSSQKLKQMNSFTIPR